MSPLCSSARHSQHTDMVPSLCHLISQQSRARPMCQSQPPLCSSSVQTLWDQTL